jgi:putative tryptophan/tyrosine transport system substrate-binding protein
MVASLNRPGGNVTGVYLLINDLEAKRLGLLSELVPGNATIGALLNSAFPPVAQQASDVQNASRTIGRQVNIYYASNDAELETAFAALVDIRAAALLSGADPFFDTRKEKIIGFMAQRRLPAIYHFREWAVSGGLMSYGISLTDTYRNFGAYAARIVQGAKPADLPVLQSVKFEFVINLKTARALSLTIPPGVLAIADEVIE